MLSRLLSGPVVFCRTWSYCGLLVASTLVVCNTSVSGLAFLRLSSDSSVIPRHTLVLRYAAAASHRGHDRALQRLFLIFNASRAFPGTQVACFYVHHAYVVHDCSLTTANNYFVWLSTIQGHNDIKLLAANWSHGSNLPPNPPEQAFSLVGTKAGC